MFLSFTAVYVESISQTWPRCCNYPLALYPLLICDWKWSPTNAIFTPVHVTTAKNYTLQLFKNIYTYIHIFVACICRLTLCKYWMASGWVSQTGSRSWNAVLLLVFSRDLLLEFLEFTYRILVIYTFKIRCFKLNAVYPSPSSPGDITFPSWVATIVQMAPMTTPSSAQRREKTGCSGALMCLVAV